MLCKINLQCTHVLISLMLGKSNVTIFFLIEQTVYLFYLIISKRQRIIVASKYPLVKFVQMKDHFILQQSISRTTGTISNLVSASFFNREINWQYLDIIIFRTSDESWVFESQSRQTQVEKTGTDSSPAKCSAMGVSVTSPRRWPL